MIIAAMKWTLLTVVVTGNDKTKWGKVKGSTHIRRRWQNIMKKLTGITGQGRNANTHFEAWNCLTTGEILDNIFAAFKSVYA